MCTPQLVCISQKATWELALSFRCVGSEAQTRAACLGVNAFIAREHPACLESVHVCVLRGAVWVCPVAGVMRVG